MSLHYIESPRGGSTCSFEPLSILVHGGALSSKMYHAVMPQLAMPSVAVDLPGHGQSVQHGPFTFQKSAELLKSLIDKLQCDEKYQGSKIVLIGISLGAQVVLDFVSKYPGSVSAAIVSGASIHPPDEHVGWEMPHMPAEQAWLDLMTEDIAIVGMDAAKAIQAESFGFTFEVEQHVTQQFPPMLICMGEYDIAMARRDFDELFSKAKRLNRESQGLIIDGAWHNHSIDIPEKFASVINKWVERRFQLDSGQ